MDKLTWKADMWCRRCKAEWRTDYVPDEKECPKCDDIEIYNKQGYPYKMLMLQPKPDRDSFMSYWHIYVQLLFYCVEFGGTRLRVKELPKFADYGKELNKEPAFKESYGLYGVPNYCQGLGVSDGIKYRLYNYYKGCKYYTDSLEGYFTTNTYYLSKLIDAKG